MIQSVVLANSFARQLKRLYQAGGTAIIIAEHAAAIIQQWVSGEINNPRKLNRNTRYGEARIKNCLKYDLVEAYRLLAVMDGESLIFVFIGNHDDCDQWLDHNKGWEPELEKRRTTILPVQHPIFRSIAEEPAAEEGEAAEDYFLAEIPERDLRIIFSGICRTRANQKHPASGMEPGQ